jgi:putative methionine-R-sulfoxide reductase with GAF domain
MRAKELNFSGLYESKANKLILEPTLGYFHSMDESQKVLTLS